MIWWDNLCKQCGFCCLKKKVINSICIIDINDPCEFLDVETKQCMIYEKRFEICSACKKMTLFHILFSSYLPDSCGYVEFFRKFGWLKKIKQKLKR